MKLGAAGLALLMLAGVAMPAGTRPGEYALVLADPPVARKVASRSGLHTLRALDHDARIAAAQKRVTDELARRKVRVTGKARMLVNAVFVRATSQQIADFKSIPGVVRVQYLPPVHRKLDHALSLVNASAAWSALGGDQNAGKGVRIGILDTGIDQNHAAFQDAALAPPAGFPKGDSNYTNNKVIVARSYVAMLPFATIDPHDSRPDDDSPRDRSGHGTAMAMIAAGERNQGPLAAIEGIAPKAFLGNYKIFGSPGVNDTTTFDVIVQALEDAINDGMDIVALPVGDPAVYGATQQDPSCSGPALPLGIPSDACDVRAEAVENAVTQMGLTVVVPAGNDGETGVNFPALGSIDTPGTAPSAITVGASSNSHLFYAGVIIPGKDTATQRMNALFGDGPRPADPIGAPVRDVAQLGNDGMACTALRAGSLAGAIALVQRGTCDFSVKVENAENAGAVGAIIVGASGQDTPFTPTGLGLTAIPAVMVGNTDGLSLQNTVHAQPDLQISLDPTLEPFSSPFDTVPSFSSRGPVLWTGAIKPELVAVGTDMYTATQTYDPNGDLWDPSGYTAAQGTSFAAALVAGAAALVKQAHPNFTPGQIKSAMVNTANGHVTDSGAAASVTAVGAGKLDAGAAVTAPATVEPATVSFGILDSTVTFPVTVPLVLTNIGTTAQKFSVAVQATTQDSIAHVTVTPGTGTAGPGKTQLTVGLQGGLPAAGSYEGFILIQFGTATLRVPYLYLAGDGMPDNVLTLAGASFTGSVNDTDFFLILKVIDRFGVAVPGLPVGFNLGLGDGVITAADSQTDLLGIAAAQVNFGSQLGDQTFTADLTGFQVGFDGRARLRPAINSGGVVNAGNHQAGKGLAPGSYVEIYGVGLSEAARVSSLPFLPAALSGVSVSFDAPGLSVPGHVYFVTPNQVDVQIPWELQGLNSASMKVSVGDSQSAVYTVPLAAASPAPFQIPDSQGNQLVCAALDQNYRVISSANPAGRGQAISLYVNGLGAVDHTPASGDPTPAPPQPFARTRVTPQVTIGGLEAQVLFSGLAPFYVGLYQLNVTVPAQAPTGLQPVVITLNGVDSIPAKLPVQ